MKKLLLLLILSFFSTTGFSASCPDLSEPTRTVSADGSYYIYTCDNSSNDDANNTLTSSSGDTPITCEMPKNAHFREGGSSYAVERCDWSCDAGYIMLNNSSCIKFAAPIPKNAQSNSIAKDGWDCNTGYVREQNYCMKKPPYAKIILDGWECWDGFKKSGVRCAPIVPENATQSGLYSWTCNKGYQKSGKSCVKKLENETKTLDDDKVYSASSGSGFAVTSDGYVVTNYHVIEGCTDVKIHEKGKSILATIVTFDPLNDIALLKGDFKPRNFYPLSRKTPKILTEIYVAGHPFGQAISTSVKVTKGIISSLSGIANNFSNLQIDAALQPGNSGGPIMNDKGNVIGVAVAKLDLEFVLEEFDTIPENVNFGVKSNVVINILESENIKLPTPNINTIPTSELGELITDGTYYLSCWMTMAQINKARETKVIFKNFN